MQHLDQQLRIGQVVERLGNEGAGNTTTVKRRAAHYLQVAGANMRFYPQHLQNTDELTKTLRQRLLKALRQMREQRHLKSVPIFC